MKTYILAFALVSLPLFAGSKDCMTDAMKRSLNFKLQNISLNVSVDEEVTFSCKNLTRYDIKELQAIRADQKKLIVDTDAKLSRGQSIRTLDISRLGGELGNSTVSSKDLCPALESNYQSQLSRSLANTFPKELRKCPNSYNDLRAKYVEAVSASESANLPIQDACQTLIKRLQRIKTEYAGNCGVADARPRNRLGMFAVRAPAADKKNLKRN